MNNSQTTETHNILLFLFDTTSKIMTRNFQNEYINTKLKGYILQLFSQSSSRISAAASRLSLKIALYKTHMTFTPRRIDRYVLLRISKST